MFSMSRHSFQSHDIASTMLRHRIYNVATLHLQCCSIRLSHLKIFESHDTCPNSRVSSLLKKNLTEKLKFKIKFLKHLNPNSSTSFTFETLATMSSPSSPTLNEVIMKNMEERAEQPENQETTPANEIREEVKEVEGDSGGAEIFLIDKGA